MTAPLQAALSGLVCLLVLLGARPALGSSFAEHARWYSQVYGTQAGLPDGVINAIDQDPNGQLWLGTTTGLVKFDGMQFSKWGDNGEPPLPSHNVQALMVSRDGSLWLGFADGGAAHFADGRLVTYTARDGVGAGFVMTFLEARDGTVWLGGRKGVARFRRGRWERLGSESGIPETPVYAFLEARQGHLWVGTAAGAFRLDRDGRATRLSQTVVRAFVQDASDVVWATDPHNAVTQVFPAAPRSTRTPALGAGSCLFIDHLGGIWVGTLGRGVLRLPGPTEQPRDVVEHVTQTAAGADQVVTAIRSDRDGDIWIATRTGLVRFFEHDVAMVTRREGLLNNTTYAIEESSDGSVWVATADGLHRFAEGDPRRLAERHEFTNLRITSLHAGLAGTVWVGTESSLGLFRQGRFIPQPFSGKAPGRVFAITTEHDGTLWVCQFGEPALSRWRGPTPTAFDGEPSLRDRPCTMLYTDRSGRVWVGFSDGGLAVHDGRHVTLYETPSGLHRDSILAIFEDSSGTFWMGTRHGLARFKDERFTTLSSEHGLADLEINAITEDDAHNLWLAAGRSIVSIRRDEFDQLASDPAHHVRYVSYDSSDGLLEATTRYGIPSLARGANGALWFQTVNGTAVIDPSRLRPTRRSAQPAIDRVIVDNRLRLSSQTSVTIPAGSATIEIDYTAVSLSSAAKVRFEYKLEGVDPDWVLAGQRRQAFYTHLAPGDYTFRVRSRIAGGQASHASLAMNVLPTFYQRRAFSWMVAIAACLGLWSLWAMRMRALQRQFGAVLAERTRIGREIHDTLLQSIAAMALRLEGLALQADGLRGSISDDIRQLRRQAQEHVREMRDIISDLRQPGSAHSLVEALHAFTANTASPHGPHCTLSVHGTPRRLAPGREREVLRIAQEAVHNAQRHSKASNVSVNLTYDTDCVSLCVSDDGVGMPDGAAALAPTERRWGVTGMRERAAGLNGTLTITSMQGRGTEVSVRIPYIGVSEAM